jgi:hypothetical protein
MKPLPSISLVSSISTSSPLTRDTDTPIPPAIRALTPTSFSRQTGAANARVDFLGEQQAEVIRTVRAMATIASGAYPLQAALRVAHPAIERDMAVSAPSTTRSSSSPENGFRST